MRKNETEEVRAAFAGRALDLRIIDASEQFSEGFGGRNRPGGKAQDASAREFVRAFEEGRARLRQSSFLAQGTIYPDVVESGSKNKSAVIKSHHNVGGLPKDMSFEGVVEPLRGLFKDEVRALGRDAGSAQDAGRAPALPRPRPGHPRNRRGNARDACTSCARPTPSCARKSAAAASEGRSVLLPC